MGPQLTVETCHVNALTGTHTFDAQDPGGDDTATFARISSVRGLCPHVLHTVTDDLVLPMLVGGMKFL